MNKDRQKQAKAEANAAVEKQLSNYMCNFLSSMEKCIVDNNNLTLSEKDMVELVRHLRTIAVGLDDTDQEIEQLQAEQKAKARHYRRLVMTYHLPIHIRKLFG